jgi:hypothetical protein
VSYTETLMQVEHKTWVKAVSRIETRNKMRRLRTRAARVCVWTVQTVLMNDSDDSACSSNPIVLLN